MNIQTPNTMISEALREVAMIADLKTTALGLSRTDKRASSETTQAHRAQSGAARVVVNRLTGADTLHQQMLAVQNEARANLKECTTAWGDRRLMPNAHFQEWITRHAALDNQAKQIQQDLEDQAHEMVRLATIALGDLDVAPPSVDEIIGAYSMKYTLEPIPDGAQFQGMPAAAAEYLKVQFEANVASAYKEAQLDAMTRLAKPLENMVDRLAAYTDRENRQNNGEAVGKEGYFRDSLITNVQDIAHVFKGFNLLGDPVLDALANKLDLFKNIGADDLRKDPNLREAARVRAKELVDDLNDLLMPTHR